MDNRSIDDIIADAEKKADEENKKPKNSSNNDEDERVLVLDHPIKVNNDRDDR